MFTIQGVMDWLVGSNFSRLFYFLVTISFVLTLLWVALALRDPLIRNLPGWQIHVRRAGLLLSQLGWLWAVVFSDTMTWSPWPPMIVVVFGQDIYFGVAVLVMLMRIRDERVRYGESKSLVKALSA